MTESAPKNTLRKVVEVSDLPPGTAFSHIGRTFIVTDEDVPVSDEDMEIFRETKRKNEEWKREIKRNEEEWERMDRDRGRERELKRRREELEIEAKKWSEEWKSHVRHIGEGRVSDKDRPWLWLFKPRKESK